jgi:hypothetical protein
MWPSKNAAILRTIHEYRRDDLVPKVSLYQWPLLNGHDASSQYCARGTNGIIHMLLQRDTRERVGDIAHETTQE